MLTAEEKRTAIIAFLDDYTYKYQFHEDDGMYHFEIDAQYDDEFSADQVKQICQSDDPMLTFWNIIYDAYFMSYTVQRDEIEDSLIDFMETNYPTYDDGDDDELRDLLLDFIVFDYPYEHFLSQSLCVNIMLDTGDGNYDFALNPHYPCWYGNKQNEALDDKASLVWLLKQQGYKKNDLNHVFRSDGEPSGSKFLDSLYVEEANLSSHMAPLTFCVQMSLLNLIIISQLIKLQDRNGHNFDARKNPDCGYIVIDKDTMCGLYNPWNGGGSVLEIELEHDVKIPVKYIWDCSMDGAGPGYSIGSVYGMCESAWNDLLKHIHVPKKFRGQINC